MTDFLVLVRYFQCQNIVCKSSVKNLDFIDIMMTVFNMYYGVIVDRGKYATLRSSIICLATICVSCTSIGCIPFSSSKPVKKYGCDVKILLPTKINFDTSGNKLDVPFEISSVDEGVPDKVFSFLFFVDDKQIGYDYNTCRIPALGDTPIKYACPIDFPLPGEHVVAAISYRNDLRNSKNPEIKVFTHTLNIISIESVDVQLCPCPTNVREAKSDATETEIAAESQNDPAETGANRE